MVNALLGNHEESDQDEEVFFGVSWLTMVQRQSCSNLFISMSFRGRFQTWKNLPTYMDDEIYAHNIGPSYYPTDFGACCLFIPHLDFEMSDDNLTYEELYGGLKADAQSGQKNGLRLLLDAEQFNYANIPANDRVGFKMALHSHTDKPMMQFSSQLINVGTETHVNLIPTISYTTKDAIIMMNPEERQCYANREANLTYVPDYLGFKYSLDNCLLNQLIADIIWNCQCIPAFASTWIFDAFEELSYCSYEELYCANQKMDSVVMGNKTISGYDSKLFGNVSKPPSINCRSACKHQENTIQVSNVHFPKMENFFYKKKFCHVASHIWQATCQDEDRKHFLDKKQPELCMTLKSFQEYFGYNSTCKKWPNNFLEKYDSHRNNTLEQQIYQYGRENLAFVQVMIQSPYITKIKRDIAMTITTYIGNTGGVLSLCLGCSFISIVEILVWIYFCCFESLKKAKKYCSSLSRNLMNGAD